MESMRTVAMSNEEVHSNVVRISRLIPREYVQNQLDKLSYPLMKKMFDSVSDGNFYTIRVFRSVVPRDDYDEYRTEMYLGKVKSIQLEWKPPKKLNFKERLHALFTGEVPLQATRYE